MKSEASASLFYVIDSKLCPNLKRFPSPSGTTSPNSHRG